MACPSCGCKETYTYDDEDYPQDGMERCAACGRIFDIEDHVGEDENMDTDQQSQRTTQQKIEPWGYAVGGNHRDVWTGRWVRAFAATEQDKAVGKALHEVADTVNAAARVVPAEARRNRVYVAGPMSGMPGHNFPAFNAAAAALRAQGWQVENPADHGVVDGATWADYMHSDVCMLASCGAIHLLPGWSKSRGASLEAHIAASLGMQFQYAEGAEPALPVAVHEAVAIVLGELRGAESVSFLRAINTGHPGSFSTIHANSLTGALEQLALMVMQTGIGLTRGDTIAYAASVIDVIVQLGRSEGKRGITQIARSADLV